MPVEIQYAGNKQGGILSQDYSFGNPRNGKFFKVYLDFALLLMGVYLAEIE